ncbi:MAG: helix-turn-helix domain-containing protein [Alphaproteobacteria bacterium]|nr:helix-turn-helix domain-containing protein [Alphaproteobacteria bacterium]MBU1561507.1 helix-turn-helix domain-containing protein [Alphaproteobacteria bacterium]MBU2302620.1 helix-turn-helix domain-containing protein [Alphaproteobacteria bacterium]MBU2368305.1 helix-turn-helix domain-containing protein [Alphaproteobacteria bacterium]
MKTITKAELQEQLNAANARAASLQVRVDDVQEMVTRLQSGRVTLSELARMLRVDRATVINWAREGLPQTRVVPELAFHVQLPEVKTFLEMRAVDKERQRVAGTIENARYRKSVAEAHLAEMKVTEAAASNPLVTVLEARIKELETEIFHLKDDSVPPALPQDVCDILDQASDVLEKELGTLFDALMDNADHGDSYEDADEIREEVEKLGILRARILAAIDADFEHYGEQRLAVSRERLAATMIKTVKSDGFAKALAEELAA